MIYPVQPIVHEIFKYQQHYPVYPGIFNRLYQTMIIKEGKNKTDINNTKQQIDATIKQHEINILRRILYRVCILFAQVTEKKFQPDYY
jgi:uncharacterized phage-associated protein